MASNTLIQLTQLSENHEIRFVQEVSDRLKCVICRDILKNARQTSCGCKVCELCINNFLKDGEKPCPSKQSECADTKLLLNRDIHQDNATNKEIYNLQIFCPNKCCDTIDSVRNMFIHIEICDYREVLCEKCSKRYPHSEKMIHDQSNCGHRTVTCRYCNMEMTAVLRDTVHLDIDGQNLCDKYAGNCPNECGRKNVLIKDHLNECMNQRVECPFQSLSCDVGKMTKSKLPKHINDDLVAHLCSLKNEIRRLKEEQAASLEINSNTMALLRKTVQMNAELDDSSLKMNKTVEELKRRGPGATSSVKTALFRNATLIWKIVHFETLRSDAENCGQMSITGDPFYTSEFGYKMCLRVYPAGDGVGRGSHLSVFFVVMKGEYDDLLPWPFRQKVTLSLLDQDNHKHHTDTFKPDVHSNCYQKPTNDCNVASGAPKFIALESLRPPSSYCTNDVLFLKISVDLIGLPKSIS